MWGYFPCDSLFLLSILCIRKTSLTIALSLKLSSLWYSDHKFWPSWPPWIPSHISQLSETWLPAPHPEPLLGSKLLCSKSSFCCFSLLSCAPCCLKNLLFFSFSDCLNRRVSNILVTLSYLRPSIHNLCLIFLQPYTFFRKPSFAHWSIVYNNKTISFTEISDWTCSKLSSWYSFPNLCAPSSPLCLSEVSISSKSIIPETHTRNVGVILSTTLFVTYTFHQWPRSVHFASKMQLESFHIFPSLPSLLLYGPHHHHLSPRLS